MIGNSNDETNFPQKLLLNDTQVSKILKAFANGSSANIPDIPIFANILSSAAEKRNRYSW